MIKDGRRGTADLCFESGNIEDGAAELCFEIGNIEDVSVGVYSPTAKRRSPDPLFFKSIWCCCAMSSKTSRSETSVEARHFKKIKQKWSHSPYQRLGVPKHIKIISLSEQPCIDILL
jgi:hypothetical protein